MGIRIKNSSETDKSSIFHKLAMVLLAAAMLTVFFLPDSELWCGPILSLLFAYLFFAGYSEFVIATILIANDALGTVLFGKLSFQYLMAGLIIIKLLLSKPVTTARRLIFLFVAVLLAIQMWATESITERMFVVAAIYVLALFVVNLDGNAKTASSFFQGIAFTVVLIAVHAAISGGVEYIDLEQTREDEILRVGILGAGIGNPNVSAMLLNLGLISLWYFTDVHKIIKLLCTVLLLYVIILTSSISGLLGLMVIVLMSILLRKSEDRIKNRAWGKGILLLLIALIVMIAAYMIYMNLPAELHLEQLDSFIFRIEGKLEAFMRGDIAEATTSRSSITKAYLNYIFYEQGGFGLLFGGNPLTVAQATSGSTHNMYLTLLLQIGLLGAACFLGYVIYRLIKTLRNAANPHCKAYTVFKIYCLFAGLGISLSGNNLWALWMCILLVL